MQADKAREDVIKGCRDGQKLSKVAIYSVHRGQLTTATAQLEEAAAKTLALTPTVALYPTLRPGSYTGVLEEYAEAKVRKGRSQRAAFRERLNKLPLFPVVIIYTNSSSSIGSRSVGCYRWTRCRCWTPRKISARTSEDSWTSQERL
jgi:hypothetical protein